MAISRRRPCENFLERVIEILIFFSFIGISEFYETVFAITRSSAFEHVSKLLQHVAISPFIIILWPKFGKRMDGVCAS